MERNSFITFLLVELQLFLSKRKREGKLLVLCNALSGVCCKMWTWWHWGNFYLSADCMERSYP